MKKIKKAFTLVETAVVLFIISLLLLIIIPNVSTQQKNAVAINKDALQTELNTQAQMYMNEKGITDITEVTVNDLKTSGYLTAKQIAAIEKYNLTITIGDSGSD